MPKVPESTKSSLTYKLHARARNAGRDWPTLRSPTGPGSLTSPASCQAVRNYGCAVLRYGGSASRWGFAIYRASHNDYEPSYLPSGLTAGTPEEALDTARGLYLADPTAWITPPKS